MAPKPAGGLKAVDVEIADWVKTTYDDPLTFVLGAFPWGKPGTFLQFHEGPDDWQREALIHIGEQAKLRRFDGHTAVDPIREAWSSGHGIGKSVLVAMLVTWLMSTRPHCQGTITANTVTQMETKTWAAVRRWVKVCLTGHWFAINTKRMYHPAFPESWFCGLQSSKAENAEAFAGQHAEGSSSFYICDEASGIPKEIFETAEGGLTDGEPMIFLFGNATRATGTFYEVCFGKQRDRWHTQIIDSRTARFSNKKLIQEWIDDYGEDSDFVRVRVKGLPPAADALCFIDMARVHGAQKRPIAVLPNEPLIAGVDVSGGGAAWTVCRFRRGFDARTVPPLRFSGEQTQAQDRQLVVSALAARLADQAPERKIAAMFIDSAFGAVIVSRLKQLGYTNVFEVNFGGPTHDVHQANLRAYMWNQMKEWLPRASIPEKDERLETDLGGPGFHLNKKNQLVLESKESMQGRGVASPDDGDALALTWAMPVAVTQGHVPSPYKPRKWS